MIRLSRLRGKYITQKLLEVQSKQSSADSSLTEIEKEELEFYLRDFGIEREINKSKVPNGSLIRKLPKFKNQR